MGNVVVECDLVLDNPEKSTCKYCGVKSDTIRKFLCKSFRYRFCHPCWGHYLEECQITKEKWVRKVDKLWNINVKMILTNSNVP